MTKITRADKSRITIEIHENLLDREKKGPAEPGLDAFLPELAAVAVELSTHVAGKVLAEAAHQSRLARADAADINLGTWLRHIKGFLEVEAHRRAGPNVSLARGLHAAACPEGLAHVDDRLVEENAHCRNTLAVLKAPEHADAVARVGLPPSWITTFEAALDESDAAIHAVIQARDDRSMHIGKGRDAELTWIDLMVRLRRYIGSRARRTDTDRLREGKELLKPLLDTLAKLRADAAARATRRAAKGAGSAAASTQAAAPVSSSQDQQDNPTSDGRADADDGRADADPRIPQPSGLKTPSLRSMVRRAGKVDCPAPRRPGSAHVLAPPTGRFPPSFTAPEG